ncbi:MAG: hypothetical protein FWH27_02160 [Planctomycetaceae bacterium]|nr:hypothetical protein [Planctomycetaceae bacterium]
MSGISSRIWNKAFFPDCRKEMREPAVDAMQWYIDASRGGEHQFGSVTITVVI